MQVSTADQKARKKLHRTRRTHSLSSSSHTLSYKAAAPIFLLLNLLVFYFTGTTIFYLSLPSFDSWPFFFCTLFLLLFHSFSFFSVRSSFSLTSFRFHYLSGVTPLARYFRISLLLYTSFTHFFPLQSIYFPSLLLIGAYGEYGANRMAPWVFFPPREKEKKRVK